MIDGETFETFSKRILESAAAIPVTRGGKHTALAALSEKDRKAYVDRWWADGVDPLAPKGDYAADLARYSSPPEETKRTRINAALPEDAGETFYGWVQRALVPGPGFEWAVVILPRHVVEATGQADKAGRVVRRDTREVMTSEIIGGLANWGLGNRVRKAVGQ